MTRDDYASILRRALDEPHGLKLTFIDAGEARRARHYMYRYREQCRESGNRVFDILSFVRANPCELRIYCRDKFPPPLHDDGVSAHQSPLSSDEVPSQCRRPRGPKSRKVRHH